MGDDYYLARVNWLPQGSLAVQVRSKRSGSSSSSSSSSSSRSSSSSSSSNSALLTSLTFVLPIRYKAVINHFSGFS